MMDILEMRSQLSPSRPRICCMWHTSYQQRCGRAGMNSLDSKLIQLLGHDFVCTCDYYTTQRPSPWKEARSMSICTWRNRQLMS